MPSTAEVASDLRDIEGIATCSEAEFLATSLDFFYQERKVRTFERRENLIDELRSELALGYTIALKDILRDDPSDDSSSFERDEIIEDISIELQIVELLALVRVEYDLRVLGTQGYEPARHLERMRTYAVLETVCIADDPEQEEGRHLYIDSISHLYQQIVEYLARRARIRIHQIIRSEHLVPAMMVDADERGIPEYLWEIRRILPDERELSAIADEDGIESLSDDVFFHLIMDREEMEQGSDRHFIDYLHCFPDASQIKTECHARTVRIAIDTLMSHDEKALSSLDELTYFSDFLLHFQHFYVF